MTERMDIEKTLDYLTPSEKLRMLCGDGAWHTFGTGEIPRVRMADGPNGVRMADGISSPAVAATCFPAPSMLANSWNAAACYAIGAAMGREATALGVNLLLAPAVNIQRHPLGGRNFEYYSEDPLLSGELGKAVIAGIRSTGVGAAVKHFAANNCETMRMYSDSVVDMRALHEIYLKPFRIALKAQPEAVMTAYNKLNGTLCSQNEYLLTDVLRNQWGYNGVTLSDWGGVRDNVASLRAGLDLSMPESEMNLNCLADALIAGEIDETLVCSALRRTLQLVDDVYLGPDGDFDVDAHNAAAYNIATESVVLLKNDGKILPLTKNMKVAVCGELAETAPYEGDGSCHVTPVIQPLSPLDAFKKRALAVSYFKGYSSDPKRKAELISEAVDGTADTDAVIVYVGQPAPSEGVDRTTLSLPAEQDELIFALTAAGRKVIAVLCSAGPVLMPWIFRAYAVLYAGLNGQAGALAAVDALYGRINPSGKLAQTFPAEDVPPPPDPLRVLYKESIFVGYRYYDAKDIKPLFPFGHGMSYSDISYSDLKVKRRGDCEFDVTFTLTNSGPRNAYEIAQVYVSDRTDRVNAPVKQLGAYARVLVEGLSSTSVTVRLSRDAFEFYDTKTNSFRVPDGEFVISVAASSRDEKIALPVKVNGDFNEYAKSELYALPLGEISDGDFQNFYGEFPPRRVKPVKGEFTFDCCIADMADTFIGKRMLAAIKRRAKSAFGAGTPEAKAYIEQATATPLYSVITMSDGAMTSATAEAIITMANGKFFAGLKLLAKSKKQK